MENVFKSKWGYHSISYEAFKKLKKLHKLSWEAIRQKAKRWRWERKLLKNRYKPEPPALTGEQLVLLENFGTIRHEFLHGRKPVEMESIVPKRYLPDAQIDELHKLF